MPIHIAFWHTWWKGYKNIIAIYRGLFCFVLCSYLRREIIGSFVDIEWDFSLLVIKLLFKLSKKIKAEQFRADIPPNYLCKTTP